MIKYKTYKPSPFLDPEMEINKDLSTFNELMSVSIYLNVNSCYYELKNITTLKNQWISIIQTIYSSVNYDKWSFAVSYVLLEIKNYSISAWTR